MWTVLQGAQDAATAVDNDVKTRVQLCWHYGLSVAPIVHSELKITLIIRDYRTGKSQSVRRCSAAELNYSFATISGFWCHSNLREAEPGEGAHFQIQMMTYSQFATGVPLETLSERRNPPVSSVGSWHLSFSRKARDPGPEQWMLRPPVVESAMVQRLKPVNRPGFGGSAGNAFAYVTKPGFHLWQLIACVLALLLIGANSQNLACGVDSSTTCALTQSSSGVRCWGKSEYGEAGVGVSGVGTLVASPPASATLTGVYSVARGTYHSCAIMTASSSVKCWGYNVMGQLGDGTTNLQPSAASATVVLTGVSMVMCDVLRSVHGFVWFSCATIVLSHVFFCAPVARCVQVAAGSFHTCGVLSATGALRCWGDNT